MRTTLVLALGLATACASDDGDGPPSYLALGDSLAFGFDPLVDTQETSAFQGYPELLQTSHGYQHANASCPGEASGGFISSTGNDNNCRENRAAYPLHVAYDGTQLEFALGFLAEHPDTELVTIDLGGNDLSKLNDMCAGELNCLLDGFEPMLADYAGNMRTIFAEIQAVYDGPLVAVTFYNPRPEDGTFQFGIDRVNAALIDEADAAGALVAYGSTAFLTAGGDDPCGAGLLIEMPDGTCDLHPSPLGDQVLADSVEAALAGP